MKNFFRLFLVYLFFADLSPLQAAACALNKTEPKASVLSALCFWKKKIVQLSEQEMEKKEAAALLGVEPLQRRNAIYRTLMNITDLPIELIKIIASYDQFIFVQGVPVLSLAVISSNKFVTGGANGELRVWNRESDERPQCRMRESEAPITALKALPEGQLASSSTLRGRPVRVLNTVSEIERERMLKIERDSDKTDLLIFDTSVESDGYSPSGVYDETLKVWDTVSGTLVATLEPSVVLEVREPAATHDNNTLVGYTRVWNISQKKHRDDAPFAWYAETAHPLPGKVSRAHPWHGDYLFGCQNGKIVVQSLGPWANTYFELKGHTGAIRRFVTISDTVVASASDDGTIRIWFVPRGLCVKVIYAHTAPVRALELLDRQHLISGSDDGTARIHDISFELGQCREEPQTKEDYKGFVEFHMGR